MENREIRVGSISNINANAIGTNHTYKNICYLDTGNITKNKIDQIQVIDISRNPLPSRAQRKVADKTIIYSTVRPLQEHYGFINNPPQNLIVSTGFTTIDVTDSLVDPKYLYYCLTQKNITNFLHGIASGNVSSYPSINPEDLANLKFTIPSELNTQHKLANILSTIDEKIELNEAINLKLHSIARTIFEYWFIQFNFPDKNGMPYKASNGEMIWSDKLKKEIPKGWLELKIRDLAKQSTETTAPYSQPHKSLRYYSIPTFDDCGTYSIELGSEIKSDKFIVNKNDILVSKLNPWFNRVIYATDDPDLICSTEFVVWRASDSDTKNYLYMIATDQSFIKFCTQSATGTSNSHKRINPDLMMDYLFAGDPTIIKRFGRILNEMLMMCAQNEVEISCLKIYKDWLHPKIINGEIKPS